MGTRAHSGTGRPNRQAVRDESPAKSASFAHRRSQSQKKRTINGTSAIPRTAAKRQALSRKPRSGTPSRASREAASPLAPSPPDDQGAPSFEFGGPGGAAAPGNRPSCVLTGGAAETG